MLMYCVNRIFFDIMYEIMGSKIQAKSTVNGFCKCVSRRMNQVVAPGCGGVPALFQVHFGKSDAQITSIGSVGTMIIMVCKH